MQDPAADRDRLRHDLLDLRLTYPGTQAAAAAAGLVRQLPSALDRLDPAAIPALERFDWQPRELVGVLGEHRLRHGGPVSCVAISADGTLVASGGSSLVRLWDPGTMRLRALLGYPAVVMSLAFSRDGKALVVGGTAGAVQVWDLGKKDRPALRFTIPAATSPVYAVAFSPDNRTVAAGCHDNTTRLYDVSGKEPKERAVVTGHEKGVASLAFSPDGRTLATGSHDHTVRLWSVTATDVKERCLLPGHTGPVLALAFTPRGGLLASGGANGTVRLWAVPAGPRAKERLKFEPRAGAVNSLAFSSTGSTLALAGADGTARLWAVGGGAPRERARLEGHAGSVNGIAYAPDNKTLVTGSADWTARSWDVSGTRPKERFATWSHLSSVHSVDFAPDGQTLVSGSEDGFIRLWNLTRAPLRTRHVLQGKSVPVYCVAYSPDGRYIAAGGAHTSVRQWDATTRLQAHPCAGHPGPVSRLAYSGDGRRLLTSSQNLLLLFDPHKGAELHRFGGHETNVNCLAFAADGRRAYSGSGTYLYKDGNIVLKDGKYVYTDCVLRQWDVEDGGKKQVVNTHTTPLYSVAVAPDGRELFSGALEPVLRRWNVAPAGVGEMPPWKGGVAYVTSISVAPDGQTLATSGLDGKVIVWDLLTGKRLHEWALPETATRLAFAADSRHLAIPLATGVIYVVRMKGPPARKGP
jgi:WD40 repeat protein